MQKILILAGALFLATVTVNAQTTDNDKVVTGTNVPGDTTHPMGIRRHWDHRSGTDSARRHFDGQGWAGRHNNEYRGGDRPEFRNRMARDWRSHIHYSPDQRKAMMAINQEYRKKEADLYKNDKQTLGQYKAGLIALRKEKKGKLQALLTPEQKDQLAKAKQRRSENVQVMAAARLERLKIRLNLSDDQVAKIKSKEEDFRTQLQSLHENDDLLPQQKMEKLKSISDQHQDAVKSVLTPDQLSKYNDMRNDRHDWHHESGHRDGGMPLIDEGVPQGNQGK